MQQQTLLILLGADDPFMPQDPSRTLQTAFDLSLTLAGHGPQGTLNPEACSLSSFFEHPLLLQVIFDREEGPPKHIIPWIRTQADAQSVLVPAMDGSASILYMTVPADKKLPSLEHIRKLLPSARYM